MIRSWRMTFFTLTVSAIVLAGCGQSKAPARQAGGGTPTPNPTASLPIEATAAPAPEKTMTIQAYYGDANGTKLVEKNVSIRYKADSDKYLAALNTLRTVNDPNLAPLAEGLTFKKADLAGSTLKVDVSLDPKGQLGSDGEALLLDALKKTLFQFPELQAFDLTVDGQQVDSLMGHMDLPHPIKRG